MHTKVAARYLHGKYRLAVQQPKLTPSDVLYVGPNRDGSRKSCKNCGFWVSGRNRCILFGDTEVTADAICGYHVSGVPGSLKGKPEASLDPKTSGLIKAPEGTACDNCARYSEGHCMALYKSPESDEHPEVDPRGCCTAWTN